MKRRGTFWGPWPGDYLMNAVTIFLFMLAAQVVGNSKPHHGRPLQLIAAAVAGLLAAAVGWAVLIVIRRWRSRRDGASSDPPAWS